MISGKCVSGPLAAKRDKFAISVRVIVVSRYHINSKDLHDCLQCGNHGTLFVLVIVTVSMAEKGVVSVGYRCRPTLRLVHEAYNILYPKYAQVFPRAL